MDKDENNLHIENFILYSSSEVDSVINVISHLNLEHSIIEIVSFIHNTVLVQNLKKELLKIFPNLDIILVKHDDKNFTSLNIFTLKQIDEKDSLHSLIIHELYLKYVEEENGAKECRNNLFNRYFTDHLTNLPNVYQLRKDLQNEEDYSLVLIKIDNFMTINNFYGFVIGDYVIEQVAIYLKKIIAEHKVYKLSGAEFAFTLESSKTFYELKFYLSELYEKIQSYSVMYQNSKIFVDFTMASTASENYTKIFSKVSMALNYANEIGVPFWIYEDRMNFENDYERNLALSEVVREAVQNDKIIPYFQAISDNKTDKIVKYECLARLIDADGNVLSPVLFIPIAKKIKLYTYITKQMIEKSFTAFEENEFEFNVNLSIEDIMNSEIFHFIINKLKNSKAANRVTFEILKSESIEDFNKVEKFINEIRRYGAEIAIDNFGSGYANFSYLIKIKANYIKIDGSLISEIAVDASVLIVIETIVDFAKKLGLKIVAEYVHSSVIMDKVKELGIDYSQGFYIDEPTLQL